MRCLSKVLVILALSVGSCTDRTYRQTGVDWPYYGGNNAGNRYSPLTQINKANVNDLEIAWMYNAAKNRDPERRPRQIQTQPIVIDGILYGLTPNLELFALDAATGEEFWTYDPSVEFDGYNSSGRGVMFWEDGEDKRIFYAAGIYLHSVNALTGQAIESFGSRGKLDLHTGLEYSRENVSELSVTATTPGVIYKDVIVMGSTVSESGDALPGDIRGFNVHTGELEWIFHTIPQPGEYGYETWGEESYKKIGGANNWAGIVLDEERGTVYLGTGSPSPNFYGGDREGKNLFANSILALDAETGELEWHYQLIYHDLWDWDPPNPPNLLTVRHNGEVIDAVVQTTKDGLVYVLNRDTGESLFPVEERPVVTEGLSGEDPWPIQKFPLLPESFSRQIYTEDDFPDSTLFPDSHQYVKNQLSGVLYGEKYLPPSEDGTMVFGISGGAEWGGSATGQNGVLYQNSNEMPWIVQMTNVASIIEESVSYGNDLYLRNCAACHGADRTSGAGDVSSLDGIGDRLEMDEIKAIIKTGSGRMPSFQHISEGDIAAIIDFLLDPESRSVEAQMEIDQTDMETQVEFPYQAPYIRKGGGKLTDQAGYPGIKPPWGTLNAIDLNTGEYLWRIPLGEHKELSEKGIPITGTENTGGPLVTAGGLVFIGATKDERFRAFDKETGELVWEYQLPAGGFATPISYAVDGKQYIAIAAGGVRFGTKPGGWYISFVLP